MEIVKLQKVGGSVMMVIPVKFVRQQELRPGVPVLIKLDLKGRLVVEKITPETHPGLYKNHE